MLGRMAVNSNMDNKDDCAQLMSTVSSLVGDGGSVDTGGKEMATQQVD